VAVAVIAGIVEVATDNGGDGGDDGGGDGDGGGGGDGDGGGAVTPGTGGGENRRTIGERDLPRAVRGFINRDIIISASALPPIGGEAQKVTATADYKFDGDIKKAKLPIRMFNLKDKLTLRFDITSIERTEDATLVFRVDDLTLSTVDVANSCFVVSVVMAG
jgi:hypothetical protein